MYQDDTRLIRLHLFKRVALWSLFIGAVLGLGLKSEYDRLRQGFQHQVDQAARHGERSAKTLDVALEGFRQFVELLPANDLEAAHRYASTLRNHYPELQLFAIAQSASGEAQITLAPQLERIGYSSQRLASLIGNQGNASPVEEAYRRPLTFTDPPLSGEVALTILDRELNRALRMAGDTSGRQISDLFQFEGVDSLLLFAPVALDQADEGLASTYVMLLVRVSDLLSPELLQRSGWVLALDRDAILTRPLRRLWQHGRQPQQGWLGLLDRVLLFSSSRVISGGSEAFTLRFSYRPGWRDIDQQFLGLLLALVLALVIVAKRVVTFSYQRNLGALQERNSLYLQANYDALTGLPNVNLLMDRLERGLATLDNQHEQLVLAYLDLDQFKPINDRWGHDSGDRVLIEVAKRLRQQFRLHDTVSRIHGDEFIILLNTAAGPLESCGVEEKVLAAFAEPFDVAGQSLQLGVSLGVAVAPYDAQEAEALISKADQRMYQLKGVRQYPAERKLA
ncbi:MAG TPA: GGDEF domain-containing protein [Motiliproteus sp.]